MKPTRVDWVIGAVIGIPLFLIVGGALVYALVWPFLQDTRGTLTFWAVVVIGFGVIPFVLLAAWRALPSDAQRAVESFGLGIYGLVAIAIPVVLILASRDQGITLAALLYAPALWVAREWYRERHH